MATRLFLMSRELYNKKAGMMLGTPTLDKTTNTQVDLGYEIQADMFELKIKGFYSSLKDFIYINADKTVNKFVNIDAAKLRMFDDRFDQK